MRCGFTVEIVTFVVNPSVMAVPEPTTVYEEGCLSFPGAFVECSRPDWAVVDGFGLDGEPAGGEDCEDPPLSNSEWVGELPE